MNKICFVFLFLGLCSNMFSQEYKKDLRSQNEKEDIFNLYQASAITNYEILKALQKAGVTICKFFLPTFEKEQSIIIALDEYIDGKIVSTKEMYRGNNTYVYFTDSIPTEETIPYVDYLEQLVFYTEEKEDKAILTSSTYSGESRVMLAKRTSRENQFYNLRRYGKMNWILDKKIPLFIYASSWSDNNGDVERFCGAADLSFDEELTQELLTSSPHYFIISCTISE